MVSLRQQKKLNNNNIATLTLKSGQSFTGVSFGASTSVSGEAVFTTSLVGYPESMTDPSYTGQILVLLNHLLATMAYPVQSKMNMVSTSTLNLKRFK